MRSAAALLLMCACGPARGGDPLALYPASAEGSGALLRGTLRMEGSCLYIVSPEGGRWLAAFPAPGARWNEAERSVELAGRAVRVGAGGGFGGGEAGSGALRWFRAPDPSCRSERIWLVATLAPS